MRRQVFWVPEAEGVVEQVLGGVGAEDAEVWAERVGMGLRAALEGEVQARRMLVREVEALRWEVERLRGWWRGMSGRRRLSGCGRWRRSGRGCGGRWRGCGSGCGFWRRRGRGRWRCIRRR